MDKTTTIEQHREQQRRMHPALHKRIDALRNELEDIFDLDRKTFDDLAGSVLAELVSARECRRPHTMPELIARGVIDLTRLNARVV